MKHATTRDVDDGLSKPDLLESCVRCLLTIGGCSSCDVRDSILSIEIFQDMYPNLTTVTAEYKYLRKYLVGNKKI